MSHLFDFINYKSYLHEILGEASKVKRGIRSQFAAAVEIQPSYVTKVLDGDAHLSLEQADRASQFLTHSEEENQFFILLVELARAGTENLRCNFERQLKKMRQDRIADKKSFQAKAGLSETDKNIFYSSWQYAAVLHSLSIPRMKTKEAIATHFKLTNKRVSEIFDFLVRTGMVQMENGKVTEIRGWEWLSGDSALIARDHCNWRLMAIRSFENRSGNDIHYSSVVSLSEEDVFRIKQMILETLERSRKIVAASKEETVCSLLIDFFEL